LRRARRTLLLVRPAAVAATTPFATLTALAALLLAIAPLLQARLLLAIAVLFAGAAVAARLVPISPVIAPRLVAPRLALPRLRRLRSGRRHGRRRRRLGPEQAAEDAAEESARSRGSLGLRCGHDGLHRLRDRLRVRRLRQRGRLVRGDAFHHWLLALELHFLLGAGRLGLLGLRLGRCFRAVGFDHDQAGALEQHFRINLGLFDVRCRFLEARCRFLDAQGGRRRRCLLARRFLLLARQGFAPLVLAQLLFFHQEGRWTPVGSAARAARAAGAAGAARAARLLVAAFAVPVASPVAAAAAALLVTFTRLLRWLRWL